jgi:peroxiredoxin
MRYLKLTRFIAAATFATAALLSGGAQALSVGDKAPNFSLPATTGKQASLADFEGKALVLFFYIGAFTNT